MKQIVFTITETLRGLNLAFDTTYGLFSYKQIDQGTKLFIESIDIPLEATCLDLGCGYGPIGITLAKRYPKSVVFMVDRDFVAIEQCKLNCKKNNVTNVHVQLSDGLSQLGNRMFDVIVSNLPTHVSHDMLEWIFEDVREHLYPEGTFYVVTPSMLKNFLKKSFTKIFGNYEKITNDRTYTISCARK